MKKSTPQAAQSGSGAKPGSAAKPKSPPKPASAAPTPSAGPAVAARPQSLVIAVRLMYAGAAVTAIGLVISVIAAATGLDSLRASHPHATLATLHRYQNGFITGAILYGLLEIAAWLVVARANRAGARWARIVATVLFAIGTLNVAAPFLGHITFGNIAYSAVIWLISLAVIVYLWQRSSSEYYASRSVPRATAAERAQGSSSRRRR